MNRNTAPVITTALLMAITLVNVGNEAPSMTLVEGTGTKVSRNECSAVQSLAVAAETHGYTWSAKIVRGVAGVAPGRRLRQLPGMRFSRLTH